MNKSLDQSEPESLGTYSTRASIFVRLVESQPEAREMAWSEFRARYAPVIAGFAAKCGATRQDIDDIIQDVMTSFLGRSGEFLYDPQKGRFRGYLKTLYRPSSHSTGREKHEVSWLPCDRSS